MFIFANKTDQRAPWNKGKLTGQKPSLLPKHVWAIRTKLHLDGRRQYAYSPRIFDAGFPFGCLHHAS